tara:strand:- start:1587 stop:1757 length:171 start_codon:yes stop_codon:yes gene_type:complete
MSDVSAIADRVELVAQIISGGARSGPTTADYNFATEIVSSLDAYDQSAAKRRAARV